MNLVVCLLAELVHPRTGPVFVSARFRSSKLVVRRVPVFAFSQLGELTICQAPIRRRLVTRPNVCLSSPDSESDLLTLPSI